MPMVRRGSGPRLRDGQRGQSQEREQDDCESQGAGPHHVMTQAIRYRRSPAPSVAARSFWMSAAESCGRSIVSVILSILPVNTNGIW